MKQLWMLSIFFLIVHAAPLEATQDIWTGVERIVAIGDIHGDYEQFVILLRSAGLVDEKENWSGGKTHLVQTGDVLDRGPHSRRAMDLLMKLEKQAHQAGGAVHALIGNHEAMNVYGDLRYVSPAEYAAFRDQNSDPDPADSEHPPGYSEHRENLGPKGKYGKWICSHNAVIKINDTLFLHGGISPKYVKGSIGKINETIREELKGFRKLRRGIVLDPKGPFWYRGLAWDQEETLETHLLRVLENYKVRRIVVAHSTTMGTIMPRFNARVLLIDAGLSKFYGGRLACLLIEDAKVYSLHRGQKLEIPSDSEEGLLRYLKRAASLDPSPSPLQSAIDQLETKLAHDAPVAAPAVP